VLINNGAHNETCVGIKTDNNMTPFLLACQNGCTEIVKFLLLHVDMGTTTSTGATALMIACLHGHKEVVKVLLEYDTQIVTQCDSFGDTALIKACISNFESIDIVRLLLENGAEVNTQNKTGFSALLASCINQCTDIVKLLLQVGADVNTIDMHGCTPLKCALRHGDDDIGIVKLLLKYGAIITDCDNEGRSLLWHTQMKGTCGSVKLLLEYGADVNLQDNQGSTVLMIAVIYGSLASVSLLLEYGADVNLVDSINKKAVDYAYTEEVRCLLNSEWNTKYILK
jgi:ankyrin repeat protein